MTTKTIRLKNPSEGIKALYQWIPISLILLTATALFTYRLGSESLWIDELFSIRDASLPTLVDVYEGVRQRPLYYLWLHVWMKLGSGDAWLRLPSVISAVVSVFLLYQLGRRIAGETEGLVAALLMSIAPLFIHHTQEVRMYVMSLGLGLAGTIFLANALLSPRSQKPSHKVMGSWALFRLLAIYTAPLNLMLLLPDAVLVLLRFRKERAVLFSFAAWASLVVLLWSPSVLSIAEAAAPTSEFTVSRAQYLDPPGLNNLVYPLKFWMVPLPIVRTGAAAHIFYRLFTLLVAGIVGAGLICKHKSPGLLWASAWFVFPLIPIIVFARISAQIWEPRYVLFVLPYLFILIAAGFTRLWRQWRIAAVVAAVIYLFGMSWALGDYYTVQNRQDYRFNVETIEQLEQSGDAIVWGYEWDEPLRYYYHGDAQTYWISMSDVETPEAIAPWLDQLPTGYERLWVVLEDTRPVFKEFKAAIADRYTVDKSFYYKRDSTVMLLTPTSASALPASGDR
ncbi:MAG: glycosyltransferase family 39 protein [Phormidesmis sp.]